MPSQTVLNFVLPHSIDFQAITDKVKDFYTLKAVSKTETNRVYFDTFDWLIFQNDLVLYKQKSELYLQTLRPGDLLAKISSKTKLPHKFWWQYAKSEFKNILKKTIGIRAILPVIAFTNIERTFRVLDADKKTVLWLTYTISKSLDDNFTPAAINVITLKPLRGYENELNRLKLLLSELNCLLTNKQPFELLLNAANKKPVDYTSKINLKLEPKLNGANAVKVILKRLLKIMQQNLDGIKNDIDTEFLHDFRVAVRRTRSALTQIKGIVPDAIVSRYKSEFAKLGKATNKLRDLDVYLLNESQYKALLPEHLHTGLGTFFSELKRERAREFKKLKNLLQTPEYQNILSSWENFLLSDYSDEFNKTDNGALPVTDVAKKFILPKFNKIISTCAKINDKTPDSKLHTLRIGCKKLRYLLEFFSSLFPEDQITFLVTELKKLQDHLGIYNDLSVQQKSLLEYFEKFRQKTNIPTETFAAFGGLISVLFQEQKSIRLTFTRTFNSFNNINTRKLFDELFNSSLN